MVSGSHFGYASSCNNISVSHFKLNCTHPGWMGRLFIQDRMLFYLLRGYREGDMCYKTPNEGNCGFCQLAVLIVVGWALGNGRALSVQVIQSAQLDNLSLQS